MQQKLSSQDKPDYSEAFWVRYWYRLLGKNSHAINHFWAYLQEPCYRAVEQIMNRFTLVQVSIADGFQVAIVRVQPILRGYNPDYGSSLKAYAHRAFGNYLRDYLRQQHEIHISSDWGLLRRVSQSQLTAALSGAGFTQTAMPILIWQCFRAVCTPTPERSTRSLPTPSDAQLNAIAQRFNRQLADRMPDAGNKPYPDILPLDAQQILGELVQIASIIRSYLKPTVTSLNQPQYENSDHEQLSNLTGELTPMDQLLADEADTERQQRVQRMDNALEQALTTLTAHQQQLLTLYYQQKLTQGSVAQRLAIKQYQVSRQLRRIRRQLILEVIAMEQASLHTPPECNVIEDISDLKDVSDAIHDWLQRHYSPEPSED